MQNTENKSVRVVPNIPDNSCKEFVVYVKNGSAIITRAFHYANRLETVSPSGVEIFTGWCRFDEDGRRRGALADGEYVVNWKFTSEVVEGILWTKHPVDPKINKGEIKPFLLSFHKFGDKKPKTILAYYANEYMRGETPNHSKRYHGWLAIHPFDGVQGFITIGDQILAWAEPPSYGRAEE